MLKSRYNRDVCWLPSGAIIEDTIASEGWYFRVNSINYHLKGPYPTEQMAIDELKRYLKDSIRPVIDFDGRTDEN